MLPFLFWKNGVHRLSGRNSSVMPAISAGSFVALSLKPSFSSVWFSRFTFSFSEMCGAYPSILPIGCPPWETRKSLIASKYLSNSSRYFFAASMHFVSSTLSGFPSFMVSHCAYFIIHSDCARSRSNSTARSHRVFLSTFPSFCSLRSFSAAFRISLFFSLASAFST